MLKSIRVFSLLDTHTLTRFAGHTVGRDMRVDVVAPPLPLLPDSASFNAALCVISVAVVEDVPPDEEAPATAAAKAWKLDPTPDAEDAPPPLPSPYK